MSPVERDRRINPDWTVGELIDEFEGHDFLPTDPEKPHFLCDFCSTGVSYESEPRVGHYIADKVLNTNHPKWRAAAKGGHRPLVPLATYCEDCSFDQLYFPCEDFAEVRMFFDLDEDRVMKNVEVMDVSGRDDGIPWDPKELSEKITGIPWEQHSLMSMLVGDDLWGPENMVTFFLSIGSGVDIRELVKWDGSLDPKVLGRTRRQYEQFSEKMAEGGHSRKKFRDHVRGDDDGR